MFFICTHLWSHHTQVNIQNISTPQKALLRLVPDNTLPRCVLSHPISPQGPLWNVFLCVWLLLFTVKPVDFAHAAAPGGRFLCSVRVAFHTKKPRCNSPGTGAAVVHCAGMPGYHTESHRP